MNRAVGMAVVGALLVAAGVAVLRSPGVTENECADIGVELLVQEDGGADAGASGVQCVVGEWQHVGPDFLGGGVSFWDGKASSAACCSPGCSCRDAGMCISDLVPHAPMGQEGEVGARRLCNVLGRSRALNAIDAGLPRGGLVAPHEPPQRPERP